jgi:hypothetical protein
MTQATGAATPISTSTARRRLYINSYVCAAVRFVIGEAICTAARGFTDADRETDPLAGLIRFGQLLLNDAEDFIFIHRGYSFCSEVSWQTVSAITSAVSRLPACWT